MEEEVQEVVVQIQQAEAEVQAEQQEVLKVRVVGPGAEEDVGDFVLLVQEEQ